jgi:8-oxo-dGTP pyrophosphatase MutT (NUDIX family)
MIFQQPRISATKVEREFACCAVSVLGFVVNETKEILLLSHPARRDKWEVVNGALEAGETVLQGALREVYEEAGPEILVKPLGIVHVSTFHFDESVRFMLSISYLMAYQGGPIEPGDDMEGSEYRWFGVDELVNDEVDVIVPPQRFLFNRAVELYSLWKDQEVDLQPILES